MVKDSVKIPKVTFNSLGDFYRNTLHELSKRGDIISQAIYASEAKRTAGGNFARRITAGNLGKSFNKIKEIDDRRLMAIQTAIIFHLCEYGAGDLAEEIARKSVGRSLEDGFWYLAALGFLNHGRRREAEGVITRCRGRKVRVMIWQAIARHHSLRGDKEQTRRAMEGAAGEIRAQGDIYAVALKLCRLARRCAHLGIWDKGLELMGEVERIPVDGWPLGQITALLVSRSRSMLALGKQGEALRLAEEALKHIEDMTVEVALEGSGDGETKGVGGCERDLARLGALFVQLGCDRRSLRCLELIGSERWRQKFFRACARACIRVGRLEKAAEFIELISTPTVRLALRLEMARFYHRHGLLGDEAIMLSEAEEEEKKLNMAIRESIKHSHKSLRNKNVMRASVLDFIERYRLEPLQRLWVIKSLAKKFY